MWRDPVTVALLALQNDAFLPAAHFSIIYEQSIAPTLLQIIS